MTSFDKREKGFEDKFAHDEALKFKAEARRNKLLGLWVADMMKLAGEDAENYAKEVIKADFEEPGDEDVFRKVSGDIAKAELDVSEKEIRRKMSELMDEAVRQIQEGS